MTIEKNKLKDYANKLMFDMNDEEYEILQNEFAIILKHMDLINKIEGISKVKPMTFPFTIEGVNLREDVIKDKISNEEALSNAKEIENGEIKVPKVVV